MEPKLSPTDFDDGAMDLAIRSYLRQRSQTTPTAHYVESLIPRVREKINKLSEGRNSPLGDHAVSEALNHLLAYDRSADESLGNFKDDVQETDIDDNIGNQL